MGSTVAVPNDSSITRDVIDFASRPGNLAVSDT